MKKCIAQACLMFVEVGNGTMWMGIGSLNHCIHVEYSSFAIGVSFDEVISETIGSIYSTQDWC